MIRLSGKLDPERARKVNTVAACSKLQEGLSHDLDIFPAAKFTYGVRT